MPETAVDRIHAEYSDVSHLLQSSGEISLAAAMDANSRKALLLAAASYFETRIAEEVLSYCQEVVGKNALVPALIQNKAISRQYHTWFDWDKDTAGKFFSLFGPKFKSHMEDLSKSDEALRKSIEDFMEVGRDRNRLVHQDFATFPLEKTTEEIYEQYKSALGFVKIIPKELRNCP
jgi:RiboL-PSP-HEPN